MAFLLGLDFGEKRIGVAIADDLMNIATPHTVIPFTNRKSLLQEIVKLVEEFSVSKIIVGLPKTMKGELGPAAKKVLEQVDWFKAQLKQEWILWDERLTTKEVERILIEADLNRQKRKEVRDSLAAQRILQGYLDFQRST